MISVIIPIYKVEKYVRQCINSVLNQTYKNMEIILVDDGSPDNCPCICDDYAKQDKRVKVIHKENGGAAQSRNVGVAVATGDYGIFVDGDDYWSEETGLQQLVDRLKDTNADLLNFAYHKFYEDTGKVVRALSADSNMPVEVTNTIDQLEYLTDRSLYIASPCNKVIRLNILRELPFDTIRGSEDIEWCARLMKKAESFDYINLDFYCYRQRSGSVSQALSARYYINLKDAILGCIKIFNQCNSQKKKYLGRFSAYQFSTFIAIQAFSDEVPTDCLRELEKEKEILKYYGNSRKVQYMYYGSSILGLRQWCRLIRLTKEIWDSRREKI